MKRILVIGDAIADIYHECTFNKMCPDDKSVKAITKSSMEIRAGGAANVAINVAALAGDAIVDLISIIDYDLAHEIKVKSSRKVNTGHCIEGKPLCKERFLLKKEMILRVDNKLHVDENKSIQVTEVFKNYIIKCNPDLIILSDYNGKTINSECLAMLLEHRGKLLIDTKMEDLTIFGSGGKTLLAKLNHDEYRNIAAIEAVPERNFQALIVTSGEFGAYLFIHDQLNDSKYATHRFHVKAHPVENVDVCGCGDTFIAGLAASLIKNDDMYTAMQFANAAAATVVTQPRVAIADYTKTLKLLGREEII